MVVVNCLLVFHYDPGVGWSELRKKKYSKTRRKYHAGICLKDVSGFVLDQQDASYGLGQI